MADIRTPSTGQFFRGNAAGDVPTWNGVEWLAQPGAAPAAPIVPLSRTIFVDGTNAAPGVPDGSIAHPFTTIGAGLAAVAATIPPGVPAALVVGPGTYAEPVSIPDRDGFVLQGSGAGQTIIQAPAPAPFSLQYAPGAGSTTRRIDVRDLTVRCTIGQTAIDVASSTFAPATLLGDGIYFSRVNAEPDPAGFSATIVGIGNCYVIDCEWASSVALGAPGNERTGITNCTTFLALRSRLGDLSTVYNDAAPEPGTGRSIYQLGDGTQVETRWLITGHPICAAAPGCIVRGVPAVVPTLDATGLTNGGSHAPELYLSCIVGTSPTTGSVDIRLPPQNGAPAPAIVLLAGIVVTGPFSIRVVGGAVIRARAAAYQGVFLSTVAGSIVAGDLVDLDLRSAKFEQPALGVLLTGAIDRDVHVVNFPPVPPTALLPDVPITVGITPPFPTYVGGGYTVSTQQLGGPALGPVVVPGIPPEAKFIATAPLPGTLAVFTVTRP